LLRAPGGLTGGAHAVLALLHLEVVEQRGQHVLRPDGLGAGAQLEVESNSYKQFIIY